MKKNIKEKEVGVSRVVREGYTREEKLEEDNSLVGREMMLVQRREQALVTKRNDTKMK